MEVGAHEIQDLDDDGVADGIEDLVAGLAGGDELLGAQDGEVLGDVGLLEAELLDQGSGGELSVSQEFEDGDAGGMGEGLEDVGFESAEGILHIKNISIYEYFSSKDKSKSRSSAFGEG